MKNRNLFVKRRAALKFLDHQEQADVELLACLKQKRVFVRSPRSRPALSHLKVEQALVGRCKDLDEL